MGEPTMASHASRVGGLGKKKNGKKLCQLHLGDDI